MNETFFDFERNKRRLSEVLTRNSIQNFSSRNRNKTVIIENLSIDKKNVNTGCPTRKNFQSIPIKQYSNKFLREKEKQIGQEHQQFNQTLFVNTAQVNKSNNRIVSEFKKYKARNMRLKSNKENTTSKTFYDSQWKGSLSVKSKGSMFAIQNMLDQYSQTKHGMSQQQLLHHSSGILTKKQIYQKICQQQNRMYPNYRKKCKTMSETDLSFNEDFNKSVKISTSRALQKYSKIVKLNPEQGKIQKWKIKRDLAKSIRCQTFNDKSQMEAKQVTLAKKQVKSKDCKRMFRTQHYQGSFQGFKIKSSSKILSEKKKQKSFNQENSVNRNTEQILRDFSNYYRQEKINSVQGKGMFGPKKPKFLGIPKHKFRKIFKNNENRQNDDFQLNGWEINI